MLLSGVHRIVGVNFFIATFLVPVFTLSCVDDSTTSSLTSHIKNDLWKWQSISEDNPLYYYSQGPEGNHELRCTLTIENGKVLLNNNGSKTY